LVVSWFANSHTFNLLLSGSVYLKKLFFSFND
jgi:hypothetical protein